MSANFPSPGDLFEGRYRIEHVIGAGGFARVYRAHQTDLGREVAIKIMTPPNEGQYAPQLVERFNQEARLVSRLRDPHTITMFDYGKSRSGLLYMVFEFIDGLPLSSIIANESPLTAERVVKVLRQTLMSLEEAHALGVLHRDIKPGNIMLFEHVGRPDQVKLLDFGIAKAVGKDQGADLTADGALIGTPRYMSPEQIRGQKLTPQSDLYSLGLVAYEMLMGKKAIESNSSVTIIGAQLDPQSFDIPPHAPVPPAVRDFVNRLLAKEREHRHASATAALREIERIERELTDDAWADTSRINFNEIPVDLAAPAAARPTAAPDTVPPPSSVTPAPSFGVPKTDLPIFRPSTSVPKPMQEAPAPPPGVNTKPSKLVLILLGVGALAVAASLGMLAMKGDPTVSKTAETTPVVQDVVAAKLPVTATQAEPETQAVEEAFPRSFVVRTRPDSMEVMVNGRPGTAPLTLTEADTGFPVNVRVRLGDALSDELVVEQYTSEIVYDATAFVAARNTPEVEAPQPVVAAPQVKPKADPPVVKKSTPRVKSTTATEPAKFKPSTKVGATNTVDKQPDPVKTVPKTNFVPLD